MEHQPRQPAGRIGLHGRVEGVVERLADAGFDLVVAEDRQIAAEILREDPQIVEPEQMVGVLVRVDHRVDAADALAEQLHAQLGRRVDQQIALGQADDDAAARAAVARVGAGADRAVAADDRHAVRRARAQEQPLAAEVGRVGRGHRQRSGGSWEVKCSVGCAKKSGALGVPSQVGRARLCGCERRIKIVAFRRHTSSAACLAHPTPCKLPVAAAHTKKRRPILERKASQVACCSKVH